MKRLFILAVMRRAVSHLRQLALAASLSLSFAIAAYATTPKTDTTTADRQAQRKLFQNAWRAAARGDLTAVAAADAALDDYPLRPWLEAERRRQEPLSVTPAEMAAWLDRYYGWPFHRRLQLQWLRALGTAGDTDALLRYGAGESDPQVQCYVLLAKTQLPQVPAEVATNARALWLHGAPHPKDCDPLWMWLRRGPGIEPERVWKRFLLVIKNGHLGLAAQLARELDAAHRPWAERWLEMALQPLDTLRQSATWPVDPEAQKIIAWGLKRQIHDDVTFALALWPELALSPHFNAATRASLERELALYLALRLTPDAVNRLDLALKARPGRAADTPLLIWRARALLARQDWAEVLTTIDRLPAGERASPRWRYFRARALLELNPPAGRKALAELAAEPQYYGFLAADLSRAPYSLCETEANIPPALFSAVEANPMIEIALELFHVGLIDDARAAWLSALRGAAEPALIAAAALAARHGWHESTIATLSSTPSGQRYYTWRFPLAHRAEVVREATFRLLDPPLVFALIRAESAFGSMAESSAGALGLMQLMPATARRIAARENWSTPDQQALFEPKTNIQLGTAYLEELATRLNYTAPLWLLAAYNAGPAIADEWRRSRGHLPGDIAIETLPYKETRDYISNVLAYATVYDWRLNGDTLPLSARLGLTDRQVKRKNAACVPLAAVALSGFTAQ